MRKIASAQEGSTTQPQIVRLMICEGDGGFCFFMYDTDEDGPCLYDEFFEELDDAFEMACSAYGVRREHWRDIPDYPDGCQQDWIAPTRRISVPNGRSRFEEKGVRPLFQAGTSRRTRSKASSRRATSTPPARRLRRVGWGLPSVASHSRAGGQVGVDVLATAGKRGEDEGRVTHGGEVGTDAPD